MNIFWFEIKKKEDQQVNKSASQWVHGIVGFYPIEMSLNVVACSARSVGGFVFGRPSVQLAV